MKAISRVLALMAVLAGVGCATQTSRRVPADMFVPFADVADSTSAPPPAASSAVQTVIVRSRILQIGPCNAADLNARLPLPNGETQAFTTAPPAEIHALFDKAQTAPWATTTYSPRVPLRLDGGFSIVALQSSRKHEFFAGRVATGEHASRLRIDLRYYFAPAIAPLDDRGGRPLSATVDAAVGECILLRVSDGPGSERYLAIDVLPGQTVNPPPIAQAPLLAP
jgi:hypothetical protein